MFDEVSVKMMVFVFACVVRFASREMSGAMDLDVPLRVDSGWGPDWSEAH